MNDYMALAVSVVVALLTTIGSTAALHHVGRVLRDKKDHQRRLDIEKFTASTALGVAAVSVLVTAIAGVAFHRVWREGLLSGLDDLALLLAALVALVMLISSGLVYWSAFRDGSLKQDDLARYGKVTIKYDRKKRRYLNQARKVECELEAMGAENLPPAEVDEPGPPAQVRLLPDLQES